MKKIFFFNKKKFSVAKKFFDNVFKFFSKQLEGEFLFYLFSVMFA